MNYLEAYEQKVLAKLAEGKVIPDFRPGDTLRVLVQIAGDSTTEKRTQAFEGVCIGRKNKGVRSSFTVRKITDGRGIERHFPLYSPRVESITVVRKGKVRRAKLYYIRALRGKAARIAERVEVEKTQKKVAE